MRAKASARPQIPSTRETLLSRFLLRARSLKGLIATIAGVGALLGGLAGYWNAYRTASETISPQPIETIGTGDAGPLSIVVLPFKNLTGDLNQAYFADGITAAVTDDVARIPGVLIVSTTTAFIYKDRLATAKQIGKELGVRFALTGGVQRYKEHVVITVQLSDTASGAQLWAESFDGRQSHLLELQELVTARIANSIGQETLKAAAKANESRTSNPRAVDLTLRARAIGLTKPPSVQTFAEAIVLYRQAMALEPTNLEAMIGLATSLARSADNDVTLSSAVKDSQMRESHDLVLKARERAPEDPNVFFVLAIVASSRGDFEGAKRADEVALRLEPKSPSRFSNLADDYLDAGQPDRAIALLEQAIRLNPRSPHSAVLSNMGRAQLMVGQEGAAVEWLLKARDAGPQIPDSSVYLAAAYVRLGKLDQGKAAAIEALRIAPSLRMLEFDPPRPGYPIEYRKFWESKLLPACGVAGLPN